MYTNKSKTCLVRLRTQNRMVAAIMRLNSTQVPISKKQSLSSMLANNVPAAHLYVHMSQLLTRV